MEFTRLLATATQGTLSALRGQGQRIMLDVIGPDGDIWYRIDVPILGTIRDCAPTDYGWTGIMPNDNVLEVRSDHPGVHAQIPEHHLRWISHGECVGAYLIEHRNH